MHVIIPAAGQGQRLRPMTDSVPKCLVQVAGKPILEWQLSVIRDVGVADIAVVRGYLKDAIDYPGVRYFYNDAYESTNMVETLWCAEPVFGDAFVVAYGDILYEPSILKELLASPHAVSVVVDKDWRGYWQKRCENILDDAETLETDGAGRITSIGQKPDCPDQIQGQYIGLTMFKEEGVEILRSVYEDARADGERGINPLRGQRPYRMLYMTDILQGIIDWGFPVHEVPISRKWLEIDTLKDLKLAERAVDVRGEHFTITL